MALYDGTMPNDGLLLGESSTIRRVRELVEKLGPTGLAVLIEGPTGVGKEVVARALHAASDRPGPLVGVNVCAVPDAMFESALFGHARGAFTGAVTDHSGLVTEAHQGTLFLDEIGELALPLQAKLLRVLETRSYRKVGGRHDERSDFRLVVATNVGLRRAVADGRFRADLAYRFGAAVIEIPPLRERPDDIPILAEHFWRRLAGAERPIRSSAIRLLLEQEWPGNVRELKNVVELAWVLSGEGPLEAAHLEGAMRSTVNGGSANELQVVASPSSDRERDALVAALERWAWHVPSAAEALCVTPKTVYARLRRFGIRIPDRYHRRGPPAADDRELRLV